MPGKRSLKANASDTPYDIEYRTVSPDGRQKWIRAVGRTFYDAAGQPRRFDGITLDITERVRVQEKYRTLAETLDADVRVRTREVVQQAEELRDLSSRLLQAQDEERRHIARELHDSAGQILTALSISLAQAARHAPKEAAGLTEYVQESEQLVQQLSQEIRTMSYLLHPPLLDEMGLAEALRWYIQGLTERSGIEIALEVPAGFERLSREMELVMFRLVQECLTNIHRHSGSKSAVIRIARDREAFLSKSTMREREYRKKSWWTFSYRAPELGSEGCVNGCATLVVKWILSQIPKEQRFHLSFRCRRMRPRSESRLSDSERRLASLAALAGHSHGTYLRISGQRAELANVGPCLWRDKHNLSPYRSLQRGESRTRLAAIREVGGSEVVGFRDYPLAGFVQPERPAAKRVWSFLSDWSRLTAISA